MLQRIVRPGKNDDVNQVFCGTFFTFTPILVYFTHLHIYVDI